MAALKLSFRPSIFVWLLLGTLLLVASEVDSFAPARTAGTLNEHGTEATSDYNPKQLENGDDKQASRMAGDEPFNGLEAKLKNKSR
jgi:hypothetical protein